MPNKQSEKQMKESPKPKIGEVDKRQIKLLKSVIEDLINKQSVEIIDLLAGKKNVNEFAIAEKLKLTINQTRNILYKLSDFGLVSFIRKKDKRKGWYIYFWTLDIFQSLSLLEEKLKNKLEVLETQIKNRKQGRHYLCTTCSIEVNEETALLNDFICPECEEVYELSDDSEVVNQIGKNIEKLKKEIKLVSEERIKQEDKLGKEKERKIKKAEKEKQLKRKLKREETKKAKEKEKKRLEKENKKKGIKIIKTETKKVAKKSNKKKPAKKRTKSKTKKQARKPKKTTKKQTKKTVKKTNKKKK
jgi:transcription factor E